MPRPFLTARWTNLAIISYAVSPEILARHVPPGLELDTRDGQAFVSLVAFDFLDTRVWGVPWPGYREFPELNLRYYVRCGTERGVIFLREFVQPRLVAWLANMLYHERYLVAPLTSTIREEPDRVVRELRLSYGGREHLISVTAGKPGVVPPESSDEHFFKEHHWGFGTDRRGRAIRYQVVHPVWETYPVLSHEIDFDWGQVYGPEWKIMEGRTPCSVVLAAGSAVEVYPKGRLQI